VERYLIDVGLDLSESRGLGEKKSEVLISRSTRNLKIIVRVPMTRLILPLPRKRELEHSRDHLAVRYATSLATC
jgi:hypothetical protein